MVNENTRFQGLEGLFDKKLPRDALTSEDATAINAVYDATEQAVLDNVRTRLGELEARLQDLGLIG